MTTKRPELLALAAKNPTQRERVFRLSNKQSKLLEKRSTVYGRDLNTSDLLLLVTNQSLREIIKNEYGLGTELSWEYPTAISTTSKKVILYDGKQQYFVKVKPKYCCNPYNLALSAQFQEFLALKTNFVPPIVRTKSDDPYLRVGETILFATEYRKGRLFNSSFKDNEYAGLVLGEIHRLSEEFHIPHPRNLTAWVDTLQFVNLANQLKGAENAPGRTKVISFFRQAINKYRAQLSQDPKYVANHGDYAPFNLVYDLKGNIIAVNDFDNVNFRPRIRDLAGAIISFCDGLCYAGATSSLRKPIASSLNLDKVSVFIKGYKVTALPLAEREKVDLIAEACIRWIKIMALGIVRGDFNYEDVLQAHTFTEFIEKHLPALI